MEKQERKIKVLFVVNDLGVGGVQRLVVDFANFVRKDYFAVSVATLLDGPEFDFLKGEIQENIQIKDFSFKNFWDVREWLRFYQYVKENRSEIVGYLFSNWKGLYNSPDFPDFSDPELEQRIKEFPEQYREFSKKDFRNELEQYRLDYILSFGTLNPSLVKSLKLEKSFEGTATGIVVYAF